jgi:hypothetical protein
VPYLETPVSGSGSVIGVAKSDLSSSSLQSAVTLASATPSVVTLAEQFALSGTTITQVAPFALIYLAPDAGANLQVWQLPLANASGVPVPAQIGLISGAPFASTTICGTHTASRNLLQPTTGFGILQYAVSPNNCAVGAMTVLINYGDSSSTAPTAMPVAQTDFDDLYLSTGQLYGLIGVDPATHQLNLYKANAGVPSFAAPVALATGVTSVTTDVVSTNRVGQIRNSVAFSKVSISGSPDQLIATNTTGAFSAAFTGTTGVTLGTTSTYDNTNYYFTASVPSGGNTLCGIYAAPIAGGTTVQLAQVTSPPNSTCSVVGSDETSLVYRVDAFAAGYSALYRLATTGAGQSPALILQVSSPTQLQATMDYASGYLLVNEVGVGSSATTTAVQYRPSGGTPGVATAGPLSNAAFDLFWAIDPTHSNATSLLFTPIPNDGTYGGAQAQLFPINNLSSRTPVTCPACGSGPYVIPGGGVTSIVQLFPGVAMGSLAFAGNSSPYSGLLLNLAAGQMQVFSLTGKNVSAIF